MLSRVRSTTEADDVMCTSKHNPLERDLRVVLDISNKAFLPKTDMFFTLKKLASSL